MKTAIKDEKSFRDFLQKNGFETNYRKHINENGVDIIALKNGYAFNIEHKRLELKDNGCYRYNGNIEAEICALSTPKGNLIFVINDKTSLTKTARLLDFIV